MLTLKFIQVSPDCGGFYVLHENAEFCKVLKSVPNVRPILNWVSEKHRI
jgi:hypothetical protein